VKSCIYRGSVTHTRHAPRTHAFSYRLFMMYLDLGELNEVFAGRWLWSARRPAVAWFRRADYLGPVHQPLDEAVRDRAQSLTGSRPTGPIRVLTHLRYLGYIQNPVTFYYCFDERGDRVETILAEITNTPWGERHTYAVHPIGPDAPNRDGVTGVDHTHHFPKAFHVSPFMDMDHRYGWRFSPPGQTLRVHMENRAGGGRIFDASLSLRREEISARSLASVLALYPFMTVRVVAGIYWQALRLWLKRTPFFVHPAKRTAP
jgi:DUF1365 family protein